jgi:hypothetical protein
MQPHTVLFEGRNFCLFAGTSGPSTLLFVPLKYDLKGGRFHNNEEEEVSVLELLIILNP